MDSRGLHSIPHLWCQPHMMTSLLHSLRFASGLLRPKVGSNFNSSNQGKICFLFLVPQRTEFGSGNQIGVDKWFVIESLFFLQIWIFEHRFALNNNTRWRRDRESERCFPSFFFHLINPAMNERSLSIQRHFESPMWCCPSIGDPHKICAVSRLISLF